MAPPCHAMASKIRQKITEVTSDAANSPDIAMAFEDSAFVAATESRLSPAGSNVRSPGRWNQPL
jgi:hypothetical protein